MLKFIFLVTILLFLSHSNSHTIQSPVGDYQCYYYEMNGPPCWKFKYEFEELLNIRKDSTYLLLHLKPQGGFEVLPDSGKWEIKKEKIILHSVTNLEWKSAAYITRTFKISSLGLYEKKSIIYNKKNFWKKLP